MHTQQKQERGGTVKKSLKVALCAYVFVLALILPLQAFSTPGDADQLISLGMPPAIARKLVAIVNTLASPIDNNVYITARNAANSGNINVLKVDSGDETILNADTGDKVHFAIAGTNEIDVGNDSILYTVVTAGTPSILTSSVDAADDNTLSIGSASAASDTRGGFLSLLGNEVSSVGGGIDLTAGNVATATVDVNLEHSSSSFNVKDTTSGTMFTVTDAGAVTSAAGYTATTGNVTSTAGSFVASASGQTLHLQEATAGTKCMGSLTFNGTTAVTTSTSCAATGARIFLTPTSDPTGSTAAYCWVTNIVNGTSFDVDCDQANDGTANWLIIKEAA